MTDATTAPFGSNEIDRVRRRIGEVQPAIERFAGRSLGEPHLAMRRISLGLPANPAGIIVWRATYTRWIETPRAKGALPTGFIDVEPIGGNVVRVEVN